MCNFKNGKARMRIPSYTCRPPPHTHTHTTHTPHIPHTHTHHTHTPHTHPEELLRTSDQLVTDPPPTQHTVSKTGTLRSSAEFKSAITANDRLQNYAFDGKATGIGKLLIFTPPNSLFLNFSCYNDNSNEY